MTALADQSTMPVWPAWGWALLFAAAIVAALIDAAQRRPKATDQPVDLWPVDLEAPVELWPVCDCTGCGYPGRVAVQSFTGLRMVCKGCADEGIAHGWFQAA